VLSVILFWRWWALRKAKAEARHQALRHLAVVAQALYTGSTASYELVPDLPRMKDSTRIFMGSSDAYAKD